LSPSLAEARDLLASRLRHRRLLGPASSQGRRANNVGHGAMRWHRCTTPQEPPYQLPQQPLYPPLHKPPHPRSIGHHTHLKPLLWNTTKGPRKETTHGPQPTSRSASYRAQRGRQRRAATRRPRTDRSQRRALPHTEHSADASSEQRPGDHARTATDVAPCLIPSTARTPAASSDQETTHGPLPTSRPASYRAQRGRTPAASSDQETTHGPLPTSRPASYRAQRGRQQRAITSKGDGA
jgi:hypothetical protein